MYLSVSLSLSIYRSIYLSLSISISISISIYLFLSIGPSVYLAKDLAFYLSWSIYTSIHPSIHPSIYLSATTSKGLALAFDMFDFPMCFAPQQGALFFSTSQLSKEVRPWCVLCVFDLELCFTPQLCALFSTSQLPKVDCQCLTLLTWKCASCQNSVHLNAQNCSRAEVFCAS